MRGRLFFTAISLLAGTLLAAQSFNTFPVTTQKPPLHGRHWMAITGKPLAATAGSMIFIKGGKGPGVVPVWSRCGPGVVPV